MDTAKEIFINFIYNPFMYLAGFFSNNTYGFVVLIVFFFFLFFISDKLKDRKILSRLIAFTAVLTILLLLVSGFSRVSAYFSKYREGHPSPTPTNSTQTPSKENNTKTDTPSDTTTPTYTQPKQLYYSVSCSNCWAEGCNHNGYNYGGYDAYYYSYFRTLCQNCRCNDFKSQSYWR